MIEETKAADGAPAGVSDSTQLLGAHDFCFQCDVIVEDFLSKKRVIHFVFGSRYLICT